MENGRIEAMASWPEPRRTWLWPLTFGLITLASCIWQWSEVSQKYQQQQSEQLQQRAEELFTAFDKRMEAYQSLLRGAHGLLSSEDHVSREEFATFVSAQQFETYYPGVQALGYAHIQTPQTLNAHIEHTRAEGFANYDVFPGGTRDLYFPIEMIEPFNERNQRAFGFDLYSEAKRHLAIDTAKKTGGIVFTRKIQLKQETNIAPQAGLLLVSALYKSPNSSAQAREASFYGVVYLAFRMQDFLQNALGQHLKGLSVRVYDGETQNPDDLLFDSNTQSDSTMPDIVVTRKTGGNNWTWVVAPLPHTIQQSNIFLDIHFLTPIFVGLFFIVVTISSTLARIQAVRIAKRLNAQHIDSENRFKTAVISSPVGIIQLDKAGRIELINPQACRIFGYENTELLGQSIERLAFAKDIEIHQQARIRYLSQAQRPVVTAEVNGRCKNGSAVPIEITISSLEQRLNSPLLVTIIDISARIKERELERTQARILEDANRNLKAASEAKSLFLANMSHEFRTPLNSILGFTRRLIRSASANLSSKQIDALETIERNGLHLLGVINDLLDIARIESGKVDVSLEAVDIKTLLADVIQNAQEINKNELVEISLRNSAVNTHIETDPVKLRQILTNLVSNALKYTNRGSVTLDVATSELNGKPYMVLKVIDTGIGIPNEKLPQLFERFNRLGLDNNSKIEGAGLGLTICKGFVELLKGEISVESTLGAGSTFIVKIPWNSPSKRSGSVI